MRISQTQFRIGTILPMFLLLFVSVVVCTAISSDRLSFRFDPPKSQIVAKMNSHPIQDQPDIENTVPGFSAWLAGWEGMADILVIAIIAALILLVLFLAIIADGLEEYFRSLDRRKSAGKNTSQSAHSKWERLSFINGTIIKKRTADGQQKRPASQSPTAI
jgi:hypothetical protein